MGRLLLKFIFQFSGFRGSFQRGFHPRTPGNFCTHKSHQKAPGDPDPAFVQSDACRGDTRLPLNFCKAAGPS